MDFSDALEHIKEGSRITRDGWNAPDQWVQLQVPDENSKMTLPYIFISTGAGNLVPWVPSTSDLFAEDWYLA